MKKRGIGYNKKGLSEIVATLLIILVTLIAIGIVWAVVKNVVQEGSEQIELGQFTLDLQIKSVQVQDENVTVVVVKRNPGEGEFVGLNFIFSDGQNSESVRVNLSLGEGETKSFTLTLTSISASTLKTVSVHPIYRLSSGSEKIGGIADSFNVGNNQSAASNISGTGGASGKFVELGFSGLGQQNYSVTSSSADVVKFNKAIVDPLDVLPGQNQTFTVYVYSVNGITSVTSFTQLDNSTLNLSFVKIGTDPNNSSVDIWSASWIVNDTHAIEYRTIITAQDSNGNTNDITLTWTDSCQAEFTQGQDKTISSDCSTTAGSVAGLEGGSITIGTGVTVTISSDSTLRFNAGKSITVTASGASLVLGTGASFGNGYLYYYDGDGDASGTNSTLRWFSTTSQSGFVRVLSASSTSDCAPSDSGASYNSYGTDSDGDGYGVNAGLSCVNGGTTGGSDCNDNDISNWYNAWAPDEDGDLWGNSFGCNNGVPDGPDECQNDNTQHTSPCT